MGVRKEAFKISSNVDNLTLYAIEVRPEVSMAVRGAVVIVHGMVEHKERYLPFMEYLASIGYGSIVYDQRGHGLSDRSTIHMNIKRLGRDLNEIIETLDDLYELLVKNMKNGTN